MILGLSTAIELIVIVWIAAIGALVLMLYGATRARERRARLHAIGWTGVERRTGIDRRAGRDRRGSSNRSVREAARNGGHIERRRSDDRRGGVERRRPARI
ncbi:MAG: hypothetical protein QOJ07_1070 [Thermoleophilaceae bacterium]|nr:hypothetical protein [Thermoleophilaceae bacterium]